MAPRRRFAAFDEIWPEISRVREPTESFLRGMRSPKLTEFREIPRQIVFEQNREVVVFSQQRRMLTLANRAVQVPLASQRARAVFFTGNESQKRRTQNIIDFHDDPDTRVFFATDAGGVGLNLQRAAHRLTREDALPRVEKRHADSTRVLELGPATQCF